MADNTVLVLVSDNGGEASVKGNSYPFLGNKGSYYRGGMSGTGFVHSKLLPESVRGQSYLGQMHVTDWLPTLMGLATGGAWGGALFGAELDGVDQWDALTTLGASPRSEIVHFHDGKVVSSVQIDMWKLNLGDSMRSASGPLHVFEADLVPEDARQVCATPSLVAPEAAFSHVLSLFSRPLAQKTTRDPLRSYQRGADEGADGAGASRGVPLLSSTGIVALIGAMFAVAALISVRLAAVLAYEPVDDNAASAAVAAGTGLQKGPSPAAALWRGGAWNSGPAPTETSKLLA